MSWRAVTRSILLAAAILAGPGQSANALAHGAAHAHEAEHRQGAPAETRGHGHGHEHGHGQEHDHEQQGSQHANAHETAHETAQHERPGQQDQHRYAPEFTPQALTPQDHQHQHVHAVVDAGIKSRADLTPSIDASRPSTPSAIERVVEHARPRWASPAPPPERRHTADSPRAPPAR